MKFWTDPQGSVSSVNPPIGVCGKGEEPADEECRDLWAAGSVLVVWAGEAQEVTCIDSGAKRREKVVLRAYSRLL